MPTIHELKELEVTETPLLLMECRLPDGRVERWSTHRVTWQSQTFQARVLRHNLFEMGTLSAEGIDGASRLSVTLANADSHFSQIERTKGWKGSKLTVRFVFFDLKNNVAASEAAVVFQGVANPPDSITETEMRLTFGNRLNLQRVLLPQVRIQKRCPWVFPTTAGERSEAVTGNDKGKYSPFFRCGYSPDVTNGVGNLNGTTPFTSCDYTRAQCEQRGMFDRDARNNPTRRFGGIEFVPASILVRGHGERGAHLSAVVDNQARYNDFVPMVYGTAWYQPPIVFARNDGNLTRMEVLLGLGEIEDVLKVLVNDVEVPLGQAGANMTGTGWYNVVSKGNRTGGFNLDFANAAGQPLGDPYGSMAYLSVVVPNRLSDGRSAPRVHVLARGLKLSRFDTDGGYLGEEFTNNPAWVLLDVLRRSGWGIDEIDTKSFAAAAAWCSEAVPTVDTHGNATSTPRFQCNAVLRRRRSAAEIVRGIRQAALLYLGYDDQGRLQVRVENSLAVQQAVKPAGSNSTQTLNNGWPAYEFGDGSLGFGGIVRRASGEPSLRLWSRSSADTPNRFSLEFQNEFNEYQQDSLSLADVEDTLVSGHEVQADLGALGVANFSQAARLARVALHKSVRGNTYVEFETSVRGVGLRVGDLITLTYLKEGFQRKPFRITRLAPGQNHRTTLITAQIHEDAWYSDAGLGNEGERRQPAFELGLPRPIVGLVPNASGDLDLEITEKVETAADGSARVVASAAFTQPARPSASNIGIPILSLGATIATAGGTLAGGRTWYYAVSAVSAEGGETALSFVVRASIPPGTNTNTVTLTGLSFSEGTASFRVYRGSSPAHLLRIANEVAVAPTFTDHGLATLAAGPPDPNYDHTNVYWRLEMLGETVASIYGPTRIGNPSLQMMANEHRGMVVRIQSGKGSGQERTVLSNDATTLTLTSPWSLVPDATSRFVVAEPSWQFGAMGATSPVLFEIPNRQGAYVQIVARAANVNDQECAYELSPVTRWRIQGGAGLSLDTGVPGEPGFALHSTGQGSVELLGLSFQNFENTRTVSAATLKLWFWDELASPTASSLAAPVTAADLFLDLTTAAGAKVGDLVQVGGEVMSVAEILNAGLRYRVQRGSHGTTAEAHGGGAPLYRLSSRVHIAPFPRDFFGSPSSGTYSFPFSMPDVRIAAAELFVTNIHGNSPVAKKPFTGTTDYGIRTLSGGQITIQADGYLAIQTDIAPPFVVEASHSVRDVFARVRVAPTGAPIELRVKHGGTTYCTLTIPAGETVSNVVNGFGLAPLSAGAEVSVDVVSVGQSGSSTPGEDLTVVIRL